MRLRFVQAVSDAVCGYFHAGRVIEIDPAAPDFPKFQQWIREGLVAIEGPALEQAIAPRAVEQAIARRTGKTAAAPRGSRGRHKRRSPGTPATSDTDEPGVPVLAPNGTIICLGTGPSLTSADVEACRGRGLVVAVNDAYRLAPWADALYACDAKWWRWHQGVPTFPGRKFSLQNGQDDEWRRARGIELLRNTGDQGLELAPDALRTGRNSGYQAINLAVHLGARRIVLLGYDMRRDAAGQSHFFGEHPDGERPTLGQFLYFFNTIVAPLAAIGVEVVNCTPGSALEVFPRATLQATLRLEAAA